MGALIGRSLVIVGGTSGLGLSATRACLLAGAKVVALGRDPHKARLLEQAGDPALRVLVADATQPETAPNAIELARKEFGGFHGLYHVAGGSGRALGDGPLHAIPDSGWDGTLNLNLRSVFLSNRAAVQALLSQGGGGSIVNCGSVLGFSPSPGFFTTHAYATAKAAIIGMTRAAAAHYAPQNIRCNVLAPALVATPMSQRAQADARIREFIRTKQPLDGGRLGQPEDLDAAVVWLLSEGSRYVTGQVIAIDGGWTHSDGQIPAADWRPD
jgi:NAD(P)-dependent dehydrogenase (short-subunit alcohol dehydrogenase family)